MAVNQIQIPGFEASNLKACRELSQWSSGDRYPDTDDCI